VVASFELLIRGELFLETVAHNSFTLAPESQNPRGEATLHRENREETTMKMIATVPVAAWGMVGILMSSAYAALPAAHPGPTVNDYTAAQSERAEAAARRAGFENLEITMVQDGNFWFDGRKQGQTYNVTVTKDGQVYSSGL
jgi:hypothetical protein